jgi:serine/threonine protein kinase
MGNQHKTISQQNLPLCMHIYIYDVNIVNINSFELHNVIGKGGFSKVWRVTCKLNAKQYAMKIMSKVKIIDKHCEQSIMSERNILSKLRHPYIIIYIYIYIITILV